MGAKMRIKTRTHAKITLNKYTFNKIVQMQSTLNKYRYIHFHI